MKPSFDEFILPSKKFADVIIPRGGDNDVAIDLIVQHIHTKLGQHDLCKIYANLFVITSTFQVSVIYLELFLNFSVRAPVEFLLYNMGNHLCVGLLIYVCLETNNILIPRTTS